MKHTFTLTLTTLLMAGCATTGQPTSPPSQALTIAQAGGLVDSIQDIAVPAADELVPKAVQAVSYVGPDAPRPEHDLPQWQDMGLDQQSEALGLPSHHQRNSIVAWVPTSKADSPEQAQLVYMDAVADGLQSALADMGAYSEITEYALRSTGALDLTIHFAQDDWGCDNWHTVDVTLNQACRVNYWVQPPALVDTPAFLSPEDGQQSYGFFSDDPQHYNRLIVLDGGNGHTIPLSDLYAKASEHMPSWLYMYVAAGQSGTPDGERFPFPYLLNQGEPALFVAPPRNHPSDQ